MTHVQIRDAVTADLVAITAIYNHAVEHTTAIWNETVVDVADRADWLVDRQSAGNPVIVAIDGDEVIGYATFAQWRPHSGYRHSVEHSVYVRGGQRGRGVGTALMRELIARARVRGTHAMVAAVEAGNAGSIALHERLGFREVGRMPQVGVKFGRWLDLALLQLLLDDRLDPDGAATAADGAAPDGAAIA